MAPVVYAGVSDEMSATGTLFQDKKFWLSQKVPQRKRFVNEIQANGGEIVPLEKQADIKIVDGARKEALPGTYSFKYIEQSIRNGELEALEGYAVGPPEGTVRNVGSIIQPARSGRTKFTKEDDQELWGWVASADQNGGATSGNELYKQLETKNPRHTWQSWRDRWVKYLKGQPQPALPSTNAPPTPPSEQVVSNELFEQVFRTDQQDQKKIPFTKDDAKLLLKLGEDIMNILPENLDDAWMKWAEERDKDRNHSAQEWQDFWECSIRPLYLERKAKAKATRTTNEPRNTSSETGYETAVEDSKPVILAVTPPTKAPQQDRARTRNPSSEPKSSNLDTNNEDTVIETVREGLSQSHSKHKPKSQSMESDLSGSATQREIATDNIIQEEDGQYESTPRGYLKRKRGDSGEDFPSSSPPEALRATKKPHLGEKQPPPVEIASTPERTSEREAHRSPTAVVVGGKSGVIDLEDDGESEESDRSDYYHDEPPDDSSPLGRSASQTLSDAGGQPISKTQAAFQEPSPLIDLDVPAPEQGWDDDGGGGSEEVAELYQHQQESSKSESGGETPEQTLSDAGGQPISETQAAFREPSPLIDLDVPAPEQGWNDDGGGDGEEVEREGGDETANQQHQQEIIPDTQTLLASKTQVVDLDLTEPEGGWRDLPLSSPPPSPPHPGSTEDSHSQSTDYDAQIDRFFEQQASRGHTEEDVTTALKCTCMDPDLSEQVLAYMAEHGGEIPGNTPGVWTAEDDEALDSVESKRIMRVQEKHGKQGLETRWNFLTQYRSA